MERKGADYLPRKKSKIVKMGLNVHSLQNYHTHQNDWAFKQGTYQRNPKNLGKRQCMTSHKSGQKKIHSSSLLEKIFWVNILVKSSLYLWGIQFRPNSNFLYLQKVPKRDRKVLSICNQNGIWQNCFMNKFVKAT